MSTIALAYIFGISVALALASGIVIFLRVVEP